MQRILITGAAGFIGFHLAQRLLAQDGLKRFVRWYLEYSVTRHTYSSSGPHGGRLW